MNTNELLELSILLKLLELDIHNDDYNVDSYKMNDRICKLLDKFLQPYKVTKEEAS